MRWPRDKQIRMLAEAGLLTGEVLTDLEATVRALEKRVGELERNEHGHCTQCGKPTPTGCMTRCGPDTPCPKVRAA